MTTVFQRVRVGPYEIVHEIGRGGMAVVFFATDSRDGRRVALKLVPTGTDRDAQEVLEAERWGAKLQEQFCRISQNVPVVYEHGTEGGYFYIAMEYLDGRNLSEIVAAGPLAPDRAVGIAIQLCHFLEAAHGFEATVDGRKLRSLLHGDLKPRNIRVLWADKIRQRRVPVARAARVGRDRHLFGLLGRRSALVRNGRRRSAISGAGHAPTRAAHQIAATSRSLGAAMSSGVAGHRGQAPRGASGGSIRRCARDSRGSRMPHVRTRHSGRT